MNNFLEVEKLKVAIITHASFPNGLASTNRVIYHAKGLKENGVETKIYITLPTENWKRVKNTLIDGEVFDIPYEYMWNKTKRSKYFIGRRIHDLLSPIYTAFAIKRDKYKNALLISFCSYYVLTVLKILFFFFGIKLIAERTELPKTERGLLQLKNRIMVNFVFKNLYAFLTISRSLQKHYSKLVSKNCPVHLVPVIIDVDDIYKPEIKRTRHLVYTGPLLQKKDGIITILKSFKNIADEFPETNLYLTGDLNISSDKEKIKEEITDDIRDRIIFKGFISREEMIDLINSAAALLLAKPTSEQADTCFPTKLGEYLATGNPTVITRTGEVSYYLKDGESAYIAEPDSVDDYTEKLRILLRNPQEALQIGLKGQEAARNRFNYKEISSKIIELVKDKNKFMKKNNF